MPKEELSLDVIKQYRVEVERPRQKIDVITKMIFPNSEKLGQTIIFVKTRDTARALFTEVQRGGLPGRATSASCSAHVLCHSGCSDTRRKPHVQLRPTGTLLLAMLWSAVVPEAASCQPYAASAGLPHHAAPAAQIITCPKLLLSAFYIFTGQFSTGLPAAHSPGAQGHQHHRRHGEEGPGQHC